MKKDAFTLAEVLITLMILGIISMLVIPGAIKNANDRATVTQVKSAYSNLSRALNMATVENGPIRQWDWPTPSGSYDVNNCNFLVEKLKPYLNIQKQGNIKNEFYNYYQKNLNGVSVGDYFSFLNNGQWSSLIRLTNGSFIVIGRFNFNVTNRQYYDIPIYVDINGPKEPNRYGYDIFVFGITTNSTLYPTSYDYNNINLETAPQYCSITENINSTNNGLTCAYWILKHNNMDYKYKDVSAQW